MAANDSCDGGGAVKTFANEMLGTSSRMEMGQLTPLNQTAEQAFSGLAAAAAFASGMGGEASQLLGPDAVLTEDLRSQIASMQMSPELSQSLMTDYQAAFGALTGDGGQLEGEFEVTDPSSWSRGFWNQQAGTSPLPHQREYEQSPAPSFFLSLD